MPTRPRRRAVAFLTALVLGVPLGVLAVAMPASAATDPCAVGGNPIVCENSKPGTDPDVWDITGAGDDAIQGFATDISVNVGSTIGFKVDTDARAYTIDVYRTGWYGGDGARFITSVPVTATLPQRQPECVTDETTGLYDCGNWGVSASWAVPSTAVSGVYIARLEIPSTGQSSHITFVVRNDASTSDLLYQTSDTTWQAYNTYGGASFYQGGGPGRAYKLSYNRPFATRDWVDGRDFYFSSEYAMVRFLERNGYDVSYQSGLDTARSGATLLQHDTFLSVGHDEYWSGQQRANVEAARDAGVNLAFFSGNEIYWRTRWESSVAGTATANRTLVSYKETWSNAKIDPAAEWTGTWRDPRFASTADGGGRPENALTGTLYQSNDTDLAVTVSAEEGKLRLWRNTSLTSMTSGSTQLAAHTVGYESNEDLDNGSRPAGLIRLSTTTGAVPQYLRDYGNVTTAGTTTHHVTLYRAGSGALVFSAGSIQWAWGLDQQHDGAGAAADSRMQQATVNLLADMGAQPSTRMTTLQAATKSTDTTGPTVQVTSPAEGAAVANGASVTYTGTAADGGGRVAGVEVSTDGGSTWHPATGTTAWSYTAVQSGSGSVPVKVRAVDDSANIGTASTRTVAVSCPCSVYGQTVPSVVQTDDTGAVELGLRFTPSVSGFVTGVRFYKGAANTGTHVGSLWSSTGSRLSSVTFGPETASGWQTALFASPVSVTAGTAYVVSYTAPQGRYALQSDAYWSAGRVAPPLSVAGGFGAEQPGVFGNPGTFPSSTYGSSQYYVDVVFTTADSLPLTMNPQSPIAGASSVSPSTTVSAVLSKSATNVALTLTPSGGSAVAGQTTYDAATGTVRFTPAAALAASTTYTAQVSATAGGAGISGTSSWTFTTAAPDQVAGSTIVSLYDDADTPAILEVADPDAVTLGVRFASDVAGSVTGIRFYKGPGNTGTHVGTLWSTSGSVLAQATFQDESTTGWQTVTFTKPVAITAGTEYVASYRTTVGRYSATLGAFSGTGVQRAPLRTAADSGVYTYGTGYPGSNGSTSYLVDVVFSRDATPLVATQLTPAAGSLGVAPTTSVSVTFNAALASGASLALAASGTAVPGTSARSSDGKTLTFTPTSALSAATTYTATASGLRTAGGTDGAPVTWSFSTASADGCPCTLLGSEVPAVAAASDPDAVELGVAFRPTAEGLVTGVRFYKGAGNGGTHTGTLWGSDGTALRTVTFADESATGWQTALFDSPYEVTPGETYVVSYLAPQGHYAVTVGAFSADVTSGPLTAPAVGNGRYRYGGGFPSSTWQQSSYFVDVVFQTAPASAPTVTGTTPAADATDVSTATTVSAVLSKAPSSGTPTLALTGPSGAVTGTSAYDTASRTVTFTPSAALSTSTSYSATATLGSTVLTGGSWSFTTAAPTRVTLWADSEVPTYPAWNDTDAVQVGTRFSTSAAGTVTAIRFYKGAANTGAHVVKLWDSTGQLLAEAPSTAETASGWQTVALPTPIALTPGATYTAAYHSATGRYSVTPNGLATARTSGPLTTAVPGGAYVYGTGAPNGSSSASYGVDLVFVPSS